MDSLVIMFGLLFIIGFALIVSRAKNTSATRDTPQTRNAETHNSDPPAAAGSPIVNPSVGL